MYLRFLHNMHSHIGDVSLTEIPPGGLFGGFARLAAEGFTSHSFTKHLLSI